MSESKDLGGLENNCGALDYLQAGLSGCMGTNTQQRLQRAMNSKGGRLAALLLAHRLNLAEKAQIERELKRK